MVLRTYPSEVKTYIHTNTWTYMFTVAVFTGGRGGNNSGVRRQKNG